MKILHDLFVVCLVLGCLGIVTITVATVLGWLLLRGCEFQDHDHDLDEPRNLGGKE